MTQEEKARAYDEALKDMRVIYPNLKGDAKLAVEHAFPELRESDDERIRKEIIRYLKLVDKGEGDYAHPIVSGWIAYLEKQKEQKVDIDKLRRDLYQSGYNDGYQHGKEDAQKEQKPAEWSEEDELMMKAVIGILDESDHPKLCHWLKSLRPSWKPTEKMLEALKWAKCEFHPDCPETMEQLQYLYTELKKIYYDWN